MWSIRHSTGLIEVAQIKTMVEEVNTGSQKQARCLEQISLAITQMESESAGSPQYPPRNEAPTRPNNLRPSTPSRPTFSKHVRQLVDGR